MCASSGATNSTGETTGVESPGHGRDSQTQSAGPGNRSRDELFYILKNQRRRFVLHHLKYEQKPIDIGDLARQVAAWENEVQREEVTSKQRRRVYNALQQTHIPKLEESGMVTMERRKVALTDHAQQLDIYLDLVPGTDVPWSTYYLILSIVGTVITTASWLNIGLLSLVPNFATGAFVAVAFLISALANYHYQQQSLVGKRTRPPELREQ